MLATIFSKVVLWRQLSFPIFSNSTHYHRQTRRDRHQISAPTKPRKTCVYSNTEIKLSKHCFLTNWSIRENAIAFVDLEATFTAPVLNSGFFEVLTTSSFSFPFFFSLLSKQLMPSLVGHICNEPWMCWINKYWPSKHCSSVRTCNWGNS